MRESVDRGIRTWAVLAYALPVVGAVAGLLLGGRHRLIRWHALQALLLMGLAVAIFCGWAVLAWVLGWIPVVGAITGAMLFAFVPLLAVGLIFAYVAGILLAARGQSATVPLFGGWVTAWLPSDARR